MSGWVVVADDLTGALDAAAALAPAGGAQVLLGPDVAWPEGSGVVAVSTRTRDGDRAATPRRVGDAVGVAVLGGARVFLKVDSLLRGEVGAAVRAGLDVHRALRGPCVAVVAPAFPARGRTTRGGRVEVEGDERSEQRDVVAALAAAGLRSVVVGRREPLRPAHFLAPGRGDRVDALVVDCDSDQDLARIATELADRSDVLLVGTAGLAAQLAPPAGRDGAAEAAVDARAVLAIGSLAPAALAQVDEAVRAGIPHVPVAAAARTSGRQARRALGSGHVLLTPGVETGADPDTVAGLLADAVSEAADAADVLVLSGGHTAQAVLDRLGVLRLELVAELEPGVVASRVPGRRQLVVTKAGAFGDESTLLRLLGRLSPASSPPERSTS